MAVSTLVLQANTQLVMDEKVRHGKETPSTDNIRMFLLGGESYDPKENTSYVRLLYGDRNDAKNAQQLLRKSDHVIVAKRQVDFIASAGCVDGSLVSTSGERLGPGDWCKALVDGVKFPYHYFQDCAGLCVPHSSPDIRLLCFPSIPGAELKAWVWGTRWRGPGTDMIKGEYMKGCTKVYVSVVGNVHETLRKLDRLKDVDPTPDILAAGSSQVRTTTGNCCTT